MRMSGPARGTACEVVEILSPFVTALPCSVQSQHAREHMISRHCFNCSTFDRPPESVFHTGSGDATTFKSPATNASRMRNY